MLMALCATITLAGPSGERRLELTSLYANDGMHYLTRQPDELLTSVDLPAVAGTESTGEVWPILLSTEPAAVDPNFAALQQRAHGSLERLVQAARAAEQPKAEQPL